MAQANPSEWVGKQPLTGAVEIKAQNEPISLLIRIPKPRKSELKAKCNLSYSMTVWNDGEHGLGTVTEFGLNSCHLTKGSACTGPELVVNSLTPWQTTLQTTWQPPTGYVDEINAQIEVQCFGTFLGTLLPDVGDNDYIQPQDDIDHDLKFPARSELIAPSGNTLSLAGRTLFYGPENNELITAEKL